jgi:CelD/BcsL family acetyltransferase involved in cellulose biosynthesis
MGVRLVNLDSGSTLLSVTKNSENADTVSAWFQRDFGRWEISR